MEQKTRDNSKPASKEIKFKCKVCGKQNKLEDMKTINRFFPPLIVCQDCERKIR